MKKKTKIGQQVIDYGIFAVMLLAVSVITFCLFYRQCVESQYAGGLFCSDMKAYILEMMGFESGYEFPYPIFFKLSAFFYLFTTPEVAVALATTLLNAAAIVVTKWALNKIAHESVSKLFGQWKWLAGAWISLVAIGLFFISMLYPPTGIYLPGIKYNYLGVFTANPFHNATYMAARPFAILAFLWYVKLLPKYEMCQPGEQNLRDYLLFSVFLLAATLTKPSFTLVLVGTAGLLMLFRLFYRKFRNFKGTVYLGLTFLPTFAALLYQFQGVFMPVDGIEGGVGFGFGRIWRLYCDNIPLAVCLAVGFPLLVLILNAEQLKENTLFRFAWQFYIMSFLMAFFLYEKRFREPDFNFSWGYMYGIFFAFFASAAVLFQSILYKKKRIYIILQWAAFALHLVCGLFYFYKILQGQMYY